MSDLSAFLPILVLLVLATILAVAISLLAFLAGPKHPTAAKKAPYESGIVPLEPAPQRFPVKFLPVAMLFLIFDIETVAFFPWAVLLRRLRVFGLLEMATFLLILGIGYLYVWKKRGRPVGIDPRHFRLAVGPDGQSLPPQGATLGPGGIMRPQAEPGVGSS